MLTYPCITTRREKPVSVNENPNILSEYNTGILFLFIAALYFVWQICLFIILIKPMAVKNMKNRITRSTNLLILYVMCGK
jgi:hypothetical protein